MGVVRWLDQHFEEMLLAFFLVVLTSLTFLNVILRYIFNSGLVWSDEICKYCLIFSGFISIGCWIRHRSGICVDALVQIAPKSVQKVLNIVVMVTTLIFFLILFRASFRVLDGIALSGQVSSTLRIPMTYVYTAPVIGFGLAVLRTLQVMYLDLVSSRKEGGKA